MRAHPRNTPSATRALLTVLLIPCWLGSSCAAAADAADAKSDGIGDYLEDLSQGQVSAASLLGLSSDAVTVVQNTRGLVLALKNAATGEASVGLSVTPARTSWSGMRLAHYGEGLGARLLGNLTLSYAQGTADINGQELSRQALALETSSTWFEKDDPLLAGLRDQPDQPRCKLEFPDSPPGSAPPDLEANVQAYNRCLAERVDRLNQRWNTSRLSLSWATGSARYSGGSSFHLGRTVAASVSYGFDHLGSALLRDHAALALTWRRSMDAPVLDASAAPTRRSANMLALRLSGGSARFRGLVEGSRLSEDQVSAAQRVFKHALGIDLKLADGLWLNLRSGRMRKHGDAGDETATLMNISYSPQALLP